MTPSHIWRIDSKKLKFNIFKTILNIELIKTGYLKI